METFNYKVTTKSSLILSPRASLAFYRDLDDFFLQKINKESQWLNQEKLKVIYPFYQYGIYTEYNPVGAEYYIPGSSVKGALKQGLSVVSRFMVDDIPIPNEAIVLRNLYKAQYLDDDKSACFDVFFENVGIEMIQAEKSFTGSFNCDDTVNVTDLLSEANKSTRIRIGQMTDYLNKLKDNHYADDLTVCLQKAVDCLSSFLENKNIFLLGGYKGLLHSMEVKVPALENAGAVFLDPETMLPHGLVELELI